MPDLTMPSLGADMTSGRLLEWLVAPGQAVKKGDLVAVVDTDKAEIEIESFHDGVMGEQLVEIGTKVPIGTVLAKIETPGDTPVPAPAPEPESEPEPVPPAPAPQAVGPPKAPPESRSPPTTGDEEHHVRVSPLARRVAEGLHVDPETLHGTGPHGSVVRADVEAAATAGPPEAPPESLSPPTPAGSPPATAPPEADTGERAAAMRQAIGALMARSSREIPHYHLGTHIDMTAALAHLSRLNEERPIARRILSAALLLKATALAAAEHPSLNGFWEDDAFRPGAGIHLGVAVALRGGGLVAPALHDADTLSLDDLMAGLRDLVSRARSGRLRGSEMRDPTLTVTNLGEQGAETVHGVIYPPQVALVGFGRIAERPWANDGMVGAHPIVHATLAADHRASDGHTGGLLLAAIERRLQEPEAL